MSTETRRKSKTRPNIHFYAVFDHLGRQLSAGMSYKRAQTARKYIDSMSQHGALQAIVATPPFKVKRLQTIRRRL